MNKDSGISVKRICATLYEYVISEKAIRELCGISDDFKITAVYLSKTQEGRKIMLKTKGSDESEI